MVARVVDASALAALLFGESARLWVEAQVKGQILIAPRILPFELGNTCWVKMRRNAELRESLLTIWADWIEDPPVTMVDVDLLGALQLAQRHDVTYYDASYLWLAQAHNAQLITLDRALLRAAHRLDIDGPAPHTTPRSRN